MKKILRVLGYILGVCIFLTCLAACGIFVYQIYKLNVLTEEFLILGGIILLLLCLIGFFLSFNHKILGNLLLVLLIGFSGLGFNYFHKTEKVLDKVSIAKEEKQVSNTTFVLVKRVNYGGNLRKVGILSMGNQRLTQAAVEQFKDWYEWKPFDSFYDLGDSLLDGSIDAMMLDQISWETFKELYEPAQDQYHVTADFNVVLEEKLDPKPVDVTQEPFTVLISGKDYGDLSVSYSHSDVNILVTVNPQTHDILMLGIPRDFYIPQPCQDGQKDKLTHTGLFGAKGTADAISEFFDIPINYYVEVNFNSVVKIVDALGGITVDSPNAFSIFGHDFVVGENHLNGEEALAFTRERYSFEDGDNERSRNQMRVLEAVIDRAMSPSIIKNYSKLLDSLSDSFKTNMSVKEMTSFIKSQMKHLKDWKIEQIQVSGNGLEAVSPALGFKVYMMEPDMASVEAAKTQIEKALTVEELS